MVDDCDVTLIRIINCPCSDVLRPCKDRLGSTDRANKEVVDEVLRRFKSNQRLQIMCFQ